MHLLQSQLEASTKYRSKTHILLTKREKQILKLISLEFSDKELAAQLYLSQHTVRSHRKNLIKKFNVRKSVGLVRKGFEMGLL